MEISCISIGQTGEVLPGRVKERESIDYLYSWLGERVIYKLLIYNATRGKENKEIFVVQYSGKRISIFDRKRSMFYLNGFLVWSFSETAK